MVRKLPLILAVIVGGTLVVMAYKRGPQRFLNDTIYAVQQVAQGRY